MKLGLPSPARSMLVAGWLAILIAGPAPAAPAAAEQEDLAPIARLQKDLLGLQKNLSNTRIKLQQGMSGIGPSGTTPDGEPQRPPTPAEACCESNLERVNQKVNSMNRMLERLDIYYAERQQTDGLAALDRIRGELNIVARGVAVLKMAGTQERATQSMYGLLRPVHELSKAITALEACCPVEDPAAFEAGGKRRP